jgi:hypothetical protein
VFGYSRFLSVLVVSSLALPLLHSPALAEPSVIGVRELDISEAENSLTFSWAPVAGAAEYVAFEEIPKPEQNRDPLAPVYRGESPGFVYDGLGPREVSRIRILAIDESERVLARTLVRTSTAGAAESAQELSWIASAQGLEVFLGSRGDGVPLLEHPENRTFGSQNLEESFVDPDFAGEPETYRLVSEERAEPVPLRDPDSPLPEKMAQNHVVEVPGFLPPESGDLAGEVDSLQEVLITRTMSRQFEWESFIEDDYVPAPPFCGTTQEESGDLYFGGDGRDFSRWTNGSTNRFRMSVRADFSLPNFAGSPPEFLGWEDPSALPVLSMGESSLYVQREDGSMEELDAGTAPLDELGVSSVFINRTTAEFSMSAAASNPLCEIFGREAPSVDVALYVILHADGSYSYVGARDAAPSHSAIIATHTIQEFPPPSFTQFLSSMRYPHITCVHKHSSWGLGYLALPPIPMNFTDGNHSDPSASGDCSTVNP